MNAIRKNTSTTWFNGANHTQQCKTKTLIPRVKMTEINKEPNKFQNFFKKIPVSFVARSFFYCRRLPCTPTIKSITQKLARKHEINTEFEGQGNWIDELTWALMLIPKSLALHCPNFCNMKLIFKINKWRKLGQKRREAYREIGGRRTMKKRITDNLQSHWAQ